MRLETSGQLKTSMRLIKGEGKMNWFTTKSKTHLRSWVEWLLSVVVMVMFILIAMLDSIEIGSVFNLVAYISIGLLLAWVLWKWGKGVIFEKKYR